MSDRNYPSPVDGLLTRGEVGFGDEWPDYLALGLTSEHVPDLIRMATDVTLHQESSERPEEFQQIAKEKRLIGDAREN